MINKTGAVILQTVLMVVHQKPETSQNTGPLSLSSQGPNSVLQQNNVFDSFFYSPCHTVEGTACCFNGVGCFELRAYPWLDMYRPEAPPPQPPEKVRPKFCLYTRSNPRFDDCQELRYNETDTIARSHLVPGHKLYVIAHGFLEHGNESWIHSLKGQLLAHSDCNVITVDWGGGSAPPYAQAVANIRLVGLMAARLIATLHKLVGLRTEFCHVIGHSLGAHLAGYIGNTLATNYNLTLGRISGLDPAEPHFSHTDPVVRLDPTDAIFVDVVHTDAAPFIQGGLGMDEPVGHVDFYPNSGNSQPGCEKVMSKYGNQENSSIIEVFREHVGCDHVRSYQYYNESIMSSCQFLAVECDSWDNFTRGHCFGCRGPLNPEGWRCATLGFHSVKTAQRDALERWGGQAETIHRPDNYHVTFYTITAENPPFCRSLYRVTLAVSDSNESKSHQGDLGSLHLEIVGINGRTEEIQLFKTDQVFRPGTTIRQVVGAKQVGRVRSAVLRFYHNFNFFNVLSWRLVTSMIHCKNLTIDNLEDDHSVTLCPVKGEALLSNEKVELRPCSKPTLIRN